MKALLITENNMKEVYGRLRRFFYNNNNTGFEEWHNFDCGFKKHISPMIYIDNNRIRNIHKYPSPDVVEYKKKGAVIGIGYSYILIRLTATDVTSLQCGDKIAFCSNKIIYRTKCTWGDYKYVYSVFQVLPMSKTEQEAKKLWAERESGIFEDDYYLDYYDL